MPRGCFGHGVPDSFVAESAERQEGVEKASIQYLRELEYRR